MPGPEDPSGPSSWPLKSWIGVAVYLALFVLVLAVILRLDRDEGSTEE